MTKAIILEGSNGGGKSTAAKAISELLDIQYIHAGAKPKNEQEASKRSCNETLNLCANSVLDRCNSVSHLVYHNDCSLELTVQLCADLQVLKHAAIFVHCVGNGENVSKSYYTEEHKKEIVDNRELYRSRYLSIFKTIPHIEYDFNKMSYADLLASIQNAQ